MSVTHHYIPLRSAPPDRRGLSERELKRRLEKQGWTIWRGGLVGILRHPPDDLYPNVRRKYSLLIYLLEKHRPGVSEELAYLAAVHHGMPDYLCHHPQRGFLFVECKLGHEQLLEGQKKCIPKLQALGFSVEVHTLAEPCTKTRKADVDLTTGKKEVRERQLRLTKKLMRGCRPSTRRRGHVRGE